MRIINNSNRIARLNETVLLSLFRSATISILCRNRAGLKFSTGGQNAPYCAARVEPADQTVGSSARDLLVRSGSPASAPDDRRKGIGQSTAWTLCSDRASDRCG